MGKCLQIDIYGVIGEGGRTTEGVRNKIRGAETGGGLDRIEVNINSPGGDVFEGVGIYNVLKGAGVPVTAFVDAEASSAASVICMAGGEIVMREGAMLMIHRASALCGGDKHQLKKIAERLQRVDDQLVSIYANRTGKDSGEIEAMMDRETWLDADEAVAAGFADRVEGGALEMVASSEAWRLREQYQNVPEALKKARVVPVTGVSLDNVTLAQLKAERPDLVAIIRARELRARAASFDVVAIELIKAACAHQGLNPGATFIDSLEIVDRLAAHE